MTERGARRANHGRPGRSFEDLTLPLLRSLYRFAWRLTRNPEAAEDLVQETYLKAFKAFSLLRDPERVRPWLFQIMNRLATDRHRSESREVQAAAGVELDRLSLYDRVADEDPFLFGRPP